MEPRHGRESTWPIYASLRLATRQHSWPTATARRSADQVDFEAVVGSVYRKQEGAWQLVFHQQSLPPPVADR